MGSRYGGGLATLQTVLVDLPDRGRAIADCRRTALDRVEANVAGGEYAGHRGAERQTVGRRVRSLPAGQDEAMVVAGDLGRQPGGARCGTDQDEDRGPFDRLGLAGRAIPEDEAAQMKIALDVDDLGVQPYIDLGVLANGPDEVVRHRILDRSAANEQRDVVGV